MIRFADFRGFLFWLLITVLLAFGFGMNTAQAQTPLDVRFILETSTSDGKGILPRLTWTTTPAADSCVASGTPEWSGPKDPQGTVQLPTTSVTQTYGLACTKNGVTTAVVSWTAPTTNTDGSAYTNPGGFRVVYGTSPSTLNQSLRVTDPAARSAQVQNLAPGTWHFAVITVNALGLESALSNIANKVATAADSVTRTLELTIRFPNPPGDVGVQ
jgi:hypothetical protein